MTLWFALALMTAVAIFAVLWPLSRRAPVTGGNEIEVYKDQLGEVDRDRASGLIGSAEAEAARIEVSRRMLAAASPDGDVVSGESGVGLRRRRWTALAALMVLPAMALALYAHLGSPDLPDEPLRARSKPQDQQSIEALVAQVEAHIARNPGDGRGWEVLAPVYLRMGRADDAVTARRNALLLNGETAERQSDLGEALVVAANGIVTDEAKSAFERAVSLDAKQYKARYFIGLAAEQDGRKAEAVVLWQAMLNEASGDAPWVSLVRDAIAKAGGVVQPRGPNSDQVAAAAALSDAQRNDMVRGMVEGLASRLAKDGSDLDGWLRLMRAYMVLGESEKAVAAAKDARHAAAGDADKLRRIDDLAGQLGIKG